MELLCLSNLCKYHFKIDIDIYFLVQNKSRTYVFNKGGAGAKAAEKGKVNINQHLYYRNREKNREFNTGSCISYM